MKLKLILAFLLLGATSLFAQGVYPPTYTCGVSNITPASTPTNIATITGSSNSNIIVRITQIHFMGLSQTTGAIDLIKVIKQSAADSGGTFVQDGTNGYDTKNAASTVVCGHYTVNPVSVGAAIGTLRNYAYLIPTATSFPSGEILEAFGDGVQPIILRSGETLAFNMGGATVTGFNYTLQIEYTETFSQ